MRNIDKTFVFVCSMFITAVGDLQGCTSQISTGGVITWRSLYSQ